MIKRKVKKIIKRSVRRGRDEMQTCCFQRFAIPWSHSTAAGQRGTLAYPEVTAHCTFMCIFPYTVSVSTQDLNCMQQASEFPLPGKQKNRSDVALPCERWRPPSPVHVQSDIFRDRSIDRTRFPGCFWVHRTKTVSISATSAFTVGLVQFSLWANKYAELPTITHWA